MWNCREQDKLVYYSIFLSHPLGREGIGMEEVKKRKAEEELQHYHQKVRAKQQNEKQSMEDYR